MNDDKFDEIFLNVYRQLSGLSKREAVGILENIKLAIFTMEQ